MRRLIAASYSPREAQRFAEFRPRGDQLEQLGNIGRGVFEDCSDPQPGTCLLMSALFLERIRAATNVPAHLVAGAISVDGLPIYDAGQVGPEAFADGNLSWDGHAWIMFGLLIADISLIRTGRSPLAHRALRAFVAREFPPGRGCVIEHHLDALDRGLKYVPQHVLRPPLIAGLANGARLQFSISES